MDKVARKLAVQAEIDRRATKSGVPPELHVYEMRTHHGDEGGPRTFVPSEEVRSLEHEDYDRSLWPSLMYAALEIGTPIELIPDSSRMYRDGRTPLADICGWGYGDDHLLILNERANAALEPFVRSGCRPIPVHCVTAKLYGYHVEAVEDVLDVKHCEASWLGSGDRKICGDITKYCIHTEKLGRVPIFRTPQNNSQILMLQPVIDAIREQGLTGFCYKRIWPHSPIPQIVNVEVKKLPANRSTKPKPTLTMTATATQIPAGFVQGILGPGLSEPGGARFELLAYRLPDLSLPSGSIVAADLLLCEGIPFARRVKPGDYPLLLIAARLSGHVDERIAFAAVKFADTPVAAWEIAAIDYCKKPAKGSEHGYGVDSGAGGFCDAGAQDILLQLADPERSLQKRIEKEMKKSYRHTRSWIHVQTEAGSAAIFSSGYGDGQYQSYFGLDEKRKPVMLITDFEVLSWSRRPDLLG
jgi:hypothetical protein